MPTDPRHTEPTAKMELRVRFAMLCRVSTVSGEPRKETLCPWVVRWIGPGLVPLCRWELCWVPAGAAVVIAAEGADMAEAAGAGSAAEVATLGGAEV